MRCLDPLPRGDGDANLIPGSRGGPACMKEKKKVSGTIFKKLKEKSVYS